MNQNTRKAGEYVVPVYIEIKQSDWYDTADGGLAALLNDKAAQGYVLIPFTIGTTLLMELHPDPRYVRYLKDPNI